MAFREGQPCASSRAAVGFPGTLFHSQPWTLSERHRIRSPGIGCVDRAPARRRQHPLDVGTSRVVARLDSGHRASSPYHNGLACGPSAFHMHGVVVRLGSEQSRNPRPTRPPPQLALSYIVRPRSTSRRHVTYASSVAQRTAG